MELAIIQTVSTSKENCCAVTADLQVQTLRYANGRSVVTTFGEAFPQPSDTQEQSFDGQLKPLEVGDLLAVRPDGIWCYVASILVATGAQLEPRST